MKVKFKWIASIVLSLFSSSWILLDTYICKQTLRAFYYNSYFREDFICF